MHGSAKPRPLRQHVCTQCGTIYDLWTQDGAVSVHDITDDGQTFVQLLPIIKIEPRANKDSWRWSLLLRLPCGHEVRERLDTTDDDTARGFNRSEHLRAIPPAYEDEYKAMYHWRPDSESGNSRLDRCFTATDKRMPAYLPHRQDLIMLGFGLWQNSQSRARWRSTRAAIDIPEAA
jgi:hypothetical protein